MEQAWPPTITFSPQPIDLSACTVALHIFQLNEDSPTCENLEEETESIVAANHWVLPAGVCTALALGQPPPPHCPTGLTGACART